MEFKVDREDAPIQNGGKTVPAIIDNNSQQPGTPAEQLRDLIQRDDITALLIIGEENSSIEAAKSVFHFGITKNRQNILERISQQCERLLNDIRMREHTNEMEDIRKIQILTNEILSTNLINAIVERLNELDPNADQPLNTVVIPTLLRNFGQPDFNGYDLPTKLEEIAQALQLAGYGDYNFIQHNMKEYGLYTDDAQEGFVEFNMDHNADGQRDEQPSVTFSRPKTLSERIKGGLANALGGLKGKIRRGKKQRTGMAPAGDPDAYFGDEETLVEENRESRIRRPYKNYSEQLGELLDQVGGYANDRYSALLARILALIPTGYIVIDHMINDNIVTEHLKDPNSNALLLTSLTATLAVSAWLTSVINDLNTGLFIHGRQEFRSEPNINKYMKKLGFGGTMLATELAQGSLVYMVYKIVDQLIPAISVLEGAVEYRQLIAIAAGALTFAGTETRQSKALKVNELGQRWSFFRSRRGKRITRAWILALIGTSYHNTMQYNERREIVKPSGNSIGETALSLEIHPNGASEAHYNLYDNEYFYLTPVTIENDSVKADIIAYTKEPIDINDGQEYVTSGEEMDIMKDMGGGKIIPTDEQPYIRLTKKKKVKKSFELQKKQ